MINQPNLFILAMDTPPNVETEVLCHYQTNIFHTIELIFASVSINDMAHFVKLLIFGFQRFVVNSRWCICLCYSGSVLLYVTL